MRCSPGQRPSRLDPLTTGCFRWLRRRVGHLAEGLRLQGCRARSLACRGRRARRLEDRAHLTGCPRFDGTGNSATRLSPEEAEYSALETPSSSVAHLDLPYRAGDRSVVMGAPLARTWRHGGGGPRHAVAEVCPAYEINERQRLPAGLTRSIHVGRTTSANGATVFGPGHDPAIDLATLTIELFHGSTRARPVPWKAPAQRQSTSPPASLTRVCDLLADQGLGLQAGQRLITGSLLPPPLITEPGTWTARFGLLGEVAITFV